MSIAFAMSYTVNAATVTAVSASISTPVCAVVSTVAALTVYDMAKAIDKGMAIESVALVEKTKVEV